MAGMAGMTGGSADLRIVLLGKTGTGKSSTGNTILREKLFTCACLANSVTSACQAYAETIDGRKITVIDTPGYCDTNHNDKEIQSEIAKCIVKCSPGPHAFLIVLTVGRQTSEEKKVVEDFLKMFGEDALKYTVVLFTHGDQLERGIQQFLDGNIHLEEIVRKCGNRLHVIDNKYWNDPIQGCGDETRNSKEIKNLLNTIDRMVEQNGGEPYTNEVLQAVGRGIVNGGKEEVYKHLMADPKVASILLEVLLGAYAGQKAGTGWWVGAGWAFLHAGWLLGENAAAVEAKIRNLIQDLNALSKKEV